MKKSFFGTFSNFVKDNASTISMAGGIGCILVALYSAFKASDDVSKIHEDFIEKVEGIKSEGLSEDEEATRIKEAKSDRNVHYILAYKFVGIFGLGAIGLSLLSKYLDGMAIAGLSAFVMSKEDELKAFAKNAKDMLGEEKFKELEQKTLEDRISEKFFGESGAVLIDPRNGKLVADEDSETLFQVDVDELEGVLQFAENYFNTHGQRMSQADYLKMLGFKTIPEEAKNRWWGPKNPFKARIGKRPYLGTDGMITIEMVNGKSCSFIKAGLPGVNKKEA